MSGVIASLYQSALLLLLFLHLFGKFREDRVCFLLGLPDQHVARNPPARRPDNSRVFEEINKTSGMSIAYVKLFLINVTDAAPKLHYVRVGPEICLRDFELLCIRRLISNDLPRFKRCHLLIKSIASPIEHMLTDAVAYYQELEGML